MCGKQRAAQGLLRPFRGTSLPEIWSSAGIKVRVTPEHCILKKKKLRTSGGPVVENLPCHAWDFSSTPWSRKIPHPGSS